MYALNSGAYRDRLELRDSEWNLRSHAAHNIAMRERLPIILYSRTQPRNSDVPQHSESLSPTRSRCLSTLDMLPVLVFYPGSYLQNSLFQTTCPHIDTMVAILAPRHVWPSPFLRQLHTPHSLPR
jgi:hypothetical protein